MKNTTKRGNAKKILLYAIVIVVVIIMLGAFLLWFYISRGEDLDNECLGKQWELTGKYWDEEIPVPEADRYAEDWTLVRGLSSATSGKSIDITNQIAPRKVIKTIECLREEKVFYLF